MADPCSPFEENCGDGAYWIGRPHNLMRIDGGFGSISRDWTDNTKITYTAAGSPRAQVPVTRPYRVWDFQLSDALSRQYSLLHELLVTDPGPHVMVDPHTQVTNVLTPEASVLTRQTNYARAGRWRVEGGGWVSSALLNPAASPTNEAQVWAGAGPVNPEGGPHTASMLIASNYEADVQIVFVDANNSILTWFASAPSTGYDFLRRVSVTATPPPNTVAAHVVARRAEVVAQASLTWTEHPTDWTIGGLAQRCVITGVSDTVQQAGFGTNESRRRVSVSFSVNELGGKAV